MIAPVPAIAVETPLSADMGEMIAELNDLLLTLSPPEACYHMTAEEMSGEATTVFVARIDGKAAACGALHRHADGIAEVKRMYTRPAYQGLGLGGSILDRIIELATREGISMLVLETGDILVVGKSLFCCEIYIGRFGDLHWELQDWNSAARAEPGEA